MKIYKIGCFVNYNWWWWWSFDLVGSVCMRSSAFSSSSSTVKHEFLFEVANRGLFFLMWLILQIRDYVYSYFYFIVIHNDCREFSDEFLNTSLETLCMRLENVEFVCIDLFLLICIWAWLLILLIVCMYIVQLSYCDKTRIVDRRRLIVG